MSYNVCDQLYINHKIAKLWREQICVFWDLRMVNEKKWYDGIDDGRSLLI